jgi:hypothetical protein
MGGEDRGDGLDGFDVFDWSVLRGGSGAWAGARALASHSQTGRAGEAEGARAGRVAAAGIRERRSGGAGCGLWLGRVAVDARSSNRDTWVPSVM